MANEQKGNNQGMEKLFQKLKENKNSWHITRIPAKTKEYIINLANEDYCGDYGMAIKGLVDSIPTQDTLQLLAMLESIEQRVSKLEEHISLTLNKSQEETKIKKIKMCNGNTKKVK